MIDSIVMNKNRTMAQIHFDDGRDFTLHHSEGLVFDLVQEIFLSQTRFESSLEVTQVSDEPVQLEFNFAA